jgi:hypothetical protein
MADRAGIRFGEAVSKRRVTAVVSRFTSANFMPPVDDLPADLPAGQFAARYGAADDSRFQLQLFIIDERINNLPPYRTPGLLLER